jgi:alpha-beta hydrolase superfamily lysophospholipase
MRRPPFAALARGASLLLVATLLFFATGCAFPDAYQVRMNLSGAQPPPGVAWEQSAFVGFGGVQLYTQSWRPRTRPKAAVILVHGLKDHSDRYAATALRLVEEGYAVHAFDLRGHGRSSGARVYVDDFGDYVADLAIFVERVRAREPNRPLFLFGHSMGGEIVTLYTIAKKPELGGLVLSGAALKPGKSVSGALIATTKVLAVVWPELPVLDLDLADFSRDPAVVAEGKQDPLVFQDSAPARTAAELLRGLGRIQDSMAEVSAPLLILHGGADKVTDPDGSRQMKERARSSDKTLIIYPGLYHDLLHEPEKEKVLGDIVKWLNARAAPAPAAPTR